MNETLAFVLCLVLGLIVLFNVGMVYWARRRNPSGEVNVLQRMSRAAKNPLGGSHDQIQELSRQVALLKDTSAPMIEMDEKDENRNHDTG
jgi:hypothetical protein